MTAFWKRTAREEEEYDDDDDDDDDNDAPPKDWATLERELSDLMEQELENPGFDVFKDYDVASDEEEMRFQRTLMIVEKYHLEFALFLPKNTNIGMYVYQQIREMSEYNRGRLLWSMTSRGIENAWLISGEGYKLSSMERDAVAGRRMTMRGDICLLYTSPSPRDATLSRMPSSA